MCIRDRLEEGLLKALADESELLLEDDRHLARDVLNDAQQLLLGLFHILSLIHISLSPICGLP